MIHLSGNKVCETVDNEKCILCQQSIAKYVTSTENDCKRLSIAHQVREYIVTKRIKIIGDAKFPYHMNKICYKRYTL